MIRAMRGGREIRSAMATMATRGIRGIGDKRGAADLLLLPVPLINQPIIGIVCPLPSLSQRPHLVLHAGEVIQASCQPVH